ncbi:MAG: beta-L-arabinofuranosidase domain-containing protein, partial [Phycisphaerae bacterium]
MAFCGTAGAAVTVVARPDVKAKNDHYVSNREPLAPSPFMKLPIGAIQPRGWLREQLRLEADGFVGHLTEISRFLKKEGNAWLSPAGEGHSGWEEVPYWLKGFGDVGYVLGDERIIAEARTWIEAAIASQREDGYFGPRGNLKAARGRTRGRPDLWPNMVMLNVLQSYHEHTGDKRVPELMTRYFRWEMTIPEEDLLPPYWQQQRAADNLASIYWLYNRTGEKRLLELATRIHRHTANWTDGIPNWHNVNMSQAFRGPEVYFQQSKDAGHREAAERNWREIRAKYGQVPGGMFGGDENCRPGFTGPRQAVETCGMVEMMLSHEMLLKIDGEVKWADRCEDVAFNSLPAATTVDFKALRYLTAPNQILSDAKNHSPGVQNRGAMFLMNPHAHRCCQHNMAHGWPYYAEHLWLATPDNG